MTEVKALSFNGTTARVDLATNPTNAVNNFAVTAWIIPTLPKTTGMIFYCGNDTAGWGVGVGEDNDQSGSKLIGLYGSAAWIDPDITLANGVLQHIAFVRRGGQLFFYLNGVKVASITGAPLTPTSGRATIGAMLNTSNSPIRFFKGIIDEVVVWNIGLTDEQVAADFNNGNGVYHNPSASGIVSVFHLDEGTGTATDDEGSANANGTLAGATLPAWVNGFITPEVPTPEPVNNPAHPYTGLRNLDPRFTYEILDENGTLIVDLTGKIKSREINLIRNGVYDASFAIDIDTLEELSRTLSINPNSIFALGKSQVLIKRLGVPIFAGQLLFRDGKLGDEKVLTIKALGWFALFKDRYTGPAQTYSSQDAGAIAWDLINTSQGGSQGSFGITQGTIQTSVNRGPLTYEYKSIKEALESLASRLNGFDFEFTWDKKFNIYYPSMGVQREEFQFVFPGNIKEISISTDATELTNYAIVRGQGFGEGQIIDIRQDANSQTSYKRREKILDYSDIPDVATLQALGDEELRVKKDPIEILDITLDGNREPFLGAYGLGDRVRVQVNGLLLYPIDTYYRIDSISVKINDDDSEDVSLKLTL